MCHELGIMVSLLFKGYFLVYSGGKCYLDHSTIYINISTSKEVHRDIHIVLASI